MLQAKNRDNNPSGYLNFARTRDFHFEFTSNFIATNPTHIIIVAECINFLNIFNGTASVVYSI